MSVDLSVKKLKRHTVMEYEDPHPEEDPRYIEATEEFDRLSRNATFARAHLVQQIHDEKLFGPDYLASVAW